MEEQKFATTTSEDQFASETDTGGSNDDDNERQDGPAMFSTAPLQSGSSLWFGVLAVNKVDKAGKVLENAVIVKTLYDHDATSNRTGD